MKKENKMNNGLKAEVVFKDELDYIENDEIKSFVLDMFKNFTSDYFWDGAASSSGIHHPKISNKKHGLVLHTKLAVWWGRKLFESMSHVCETFSLDVVIAALLLHDLQKFGATLNDDGTPSLNDYAGSHGIVLSEHLEIFLKYDTKYSDIQDEIGRIILAIALHMGRWTNMSLDVGWSDRIVGEGTESQIVHMADYCASRKVDDKIAELDKYDFPYME